MVGMDELKTYMQSQLQEDSKRSFVTVTGATLEDALQSASIELSLPLKKVEYEVLEKGSAGLAGFRRKNFVVMAYPAGGQMGEFAENDFDMDMGFPADAGALSRDGEANVRLQPQGVFLRVKPPAGDGSKITEDETMWRIRERTDTRIDAARVAQIVKRADSEFVKIGEFEYDPSNDAMLQLSVTDGEMKAYLTATPPGVGGADPDYDTIINLLQSNDVVHGINEETVQAFADNPSYREPLLVAEGTKAIDGKDARIAMNFETDSRNFKLKETDGRVDFKELNLVQNVVEGQVLARKVPADEGTNGSTVTGKYLPAKPGSDARIDVGKNVRLSEDGRTAYAEINGQVVMTGSKINVEPVYVVNGDVSLKTGNIMFLGTVLVKGSVEDGFDVKASGNIEVIGSVGKCNLDADGDIIVHQGVNGKSSGLVRAGGSIWSKFIENATAEAGDRVVVSDGIINAHVTAQRKVICRGKRASIVGGVVRAAEEIDAKALGSVSGNETILEVGVDPKSKERLSELEEEKAELTKQLEEVVLNMQTIEKLHKARKKLTQDKVKVYNEQKQKRVAITGDLRKVQREIDEIQGYLSELKTSGKISASSTVFSGVKINVRDATLNVKNEFKAVTFIWGAGVVKVTKYEESDEDITISRKG
jgi:uncharacterized protein